jgi:hypothetical protein
MKMCKCNQSITWGRSPLCFSCLAAVDLVVDRRGQVVPAEAPAREMYPARYRYRGVRCGKNDCHTCPHSFYVYRCWRPDNRLKETYLGPADEKCDPYERPVLRDVRRVFG